MTNPSDLSDYCTVPIEKMKGRNWLKSAQRRGPTASGEAGSRAAFYDQRNRPTPSLPRLKFLEGK